MPVHELTNVATPSAGIVAHASGVTIGNLADGIQFFTEITAAGAVSALDFNLKPILRFNVTDDLSGAYTYPPTDVPTLPANLTEFTFVVQYVQDPTGGRAIPLATLFVGYVQEGVPVANTAPDGITRVFIIASKSVDGTLSYSVSFPQAIAGEQITYGTIPSARLPDASASVKGLIQIGTSAAAAAAGNHTHTIADSKDFVIDKSDDSALTAATYPIMKDVNFTGVVTLITDIKLEGGPGAMSATVIAKIGATDIIGTSIAATENASGDGVAVSGNRFALREAINLGVSVPTGNFTRIIGTMHIVKDGTPA